MFLTAQLPSKFWALAVTAAAYVNNRFPKSASKERSPHELWYGKKPNLSHLRTWGCIAYVHPPYETDKLEPRSNKALMVGYGKSNSLYKICDPTTNEAS